MKSFSNYIKENRDYAVGDTVWVKHPIEKSKTLTGKVTRIGSFTHIKHTDGTVSAYDHADVSTNYETLHPNPYRKKQRDMFD